MPVNPILFDHRAVLHQQNFKLVREGRLQCFHPLGHFTGKTDLDGRVPPVKRQKVELFTGNEDFVPHNALFSTRLAASTYKMA